MTTYRHTARMQGSAIPFDGVLAVAVGAYAAGRVSGHDIAKV